ncbi:TadE-like protein [Polystyrenella longa]|uniref:TadE-like protein n=1 Tax=Polystyrenella longa TaxID=2528007 RepID=A0A518CPA8_9PLAN|nr:TadE family protein [Polystyrenella longa]QDU81067.1 TadE-like protein [Polystyrenella longa]
MKTSPLHRINSFRCSEQRRGAAAVEFALTAPIFLILILGVVEIGTVLDVSNKLETAVRGGCRLASTDWVTVVPEGVSLNEKIVSDIENYLQAVGVPKEHVVIQIVGAEGDMEGQPFDLNDPDNEHGLFKVSATIPYGNVGTFSSKYMTQRDVSASLVFRSGRVNLFQ